MKKVTRKKEVKETKDIIIYIAEDGREFDKFCDCVRYERELLRLRNFSKIKTKTIINEFGQEELWYFIRDKKDLDTLMNHLGNEFLVMLYFSDNYLILFDEKENKQSKEYVNNYLINNWVRYTYENINILGRNNIVFHSYKREQERHNILSKELD